MKTVAITGASGHLGKNVLDELLTQKDVRIIATTRNPEALKDYAKNAIEIRQADFNDQETLVKAYQGVESLLIISSDAIGSRMQQHKNAIEAAQKAGVKHIIYTSWPSPNTSVAAVAPEHDETEQLILKSGLSYTILRNYLYADLLLHSIEAAKNMKAFYGSADQGKIAYVTRKDCGRTAAHALLKHNFKNQILDVTGPDAITYEDLSKVASELTAQSLPYVNLSDDDFKKGLLDSGLPEAWAQVYVTFDQAIRRGEVGKTSDTVEKLTGTKPQSILSFLKESLD